MASYSDANVLGALTSFSPYRQQLPIEQMREIGQIKQQQYETGVQKIQSQIENIAGMDVIKPIHKEYLQSKLNELGNNLKKVAAGDFSNFQLVNSVGGMTNQIVKDPVIQNAVLSTQRIRNQQSNLESAKKSGKSSIQNEAYFNRQLNDWLNDGNAKNSFNGEYIEYTDIDGKLRQIADKVKETDNSIEIPYIRDNSGKVIYDKQGSPIIDGAMLSLKTKGKPAEKILANFYDSLNENDKRQLSIDSWYHYKDTTPEALHRDIINGYNDKKRLLSDKMVNLSVELKNPNLSSVEKSQIQAQLTDVNKTLIDSSLDKEMNSQLEQLSSGQGIDDFKYRLYTQKYLGNLAKDLSYQSYEQAYKDNPYFQADMKRKDLQFKYFEENNRNLRFAQEQQLRYVDLSLKQQEYNKKYKGSEFKVTSGALPTGEVTPTLTDLQVEYNQSSDNVKQLGVEYADVLFPSEKYPSMSGIDKVKAMSKLVSDYRENPRMDLTSDQIKYLEKYRVLENDLTSHINLINDTKKKSDRFIESHGRKELDEKVGDIVYKGVPYSSTELYEVNNKLNEFTKFVAPTGMGSQGSTIFNKEVAINYFSQYEDGKYLPILDTFLKNKEVFSSLDSEQKGLIKKLEGADKVSGDIKQAKDKFESDYIAKYSPKYQSQRTPLNIKDEKGADYANLSDFIATKELQFSELGAADVEKYSQFNPSDAKSMLFGKDKDKTSVNLEKTQNGAQIVVFSPNGDRQIVPMSTEELGKFFPGADTQSPIASLIDNIRTSPGSTTNSANIRVDGDNDPSAAVNAYFSGYMLSGLKDSKYAPIVRMDVQGDKFNSGNSSKDGYDVILYVKDPSTGQWKAGTINKGGYTNEAGVINILSNINPQAIEEAIKTYK